ncbi:hypothetical protein HOLDEFILI_01257 [Holdemania filiformis DSM 12042]|uniref:Uncharacterized protein n=1 Tax=Holdemania filiformis DSM 12042 TaxID=545696 RepID=B9Y625_9FIRM|nr:hypothetical protein HOLDEFILI_01257 [Holdemania filiformis DSM 12042]
MEDRRNIGHDLPLINQNCGSSHDFFDGDSLNLLTLPYRRNRSGMIPIFSFINQNKINSRMK